MEEEADMDGSLSNNGNSDLGIDKSEEMILKHRKIMDCAKETFETGKLWNVFYFMIIPF